mgnify:FL=1
MENRLPDGNMRYSLFEAWLSNKQKAMERYFLPPEQRVNFTNKWMAFGSHVADSLEQRPIPWWLAKIKVFDAIDKKDPDKKLKEHRLVYDENEYRIIHEIGGFMMRGTLDTYDHELHKFADHKSVKATWTQGKTNKHKQLVFYSVLVEEKHDWVDEECHIFCIPVINDENDIVRLTGDNATAIARVITAQERVEMKQLMIDTATDISVCYEAYLRGDIKL